MWVQNAEVLVRLLRVEQIPSGENRHGQPQPLQEPQAAVAADANRCLDQPTAGGDETDL